MFRLAAEHIDFGLRQAIPRHNIAARSNSHPTQLLFKITPYGSWIHSIDVSDSFIPGQEVQRDGQWDLGRGKHTVIVLLLAVVALDDGLAGRSGAYRSAEVVNATDVTGVLGEGGPRASLAGGLRRGRAEEKVDTVGVTVERVSVVQHVDQVVVVGAARRITLDVRDKTAVVPEENPAGAGVRVLHPGADAGEIGRVFFR